MIDVPGIAAVIAAFGLFWLILDIALSKEHEEIDDLERIYWENVREIEKAIRSERDMR